MVSISKQPFQTYLLSNSNEKIASLVMTEMGILLYRTYNIVIAFQKALGYIVQD